MSKTTRLSLELIKAAVIIGIATNFILLVDLPGLNVLLTVALLSIALIALTVRKKPGYWTSSSIALHSALMFFAAMFAVYDSPLLLFLNFVAILGILALLVMPAMKFDLRSASIWKYVFTGFWSGMSIFFGPLLIFVNDIEWSEMPRNKLSQNITSVVRGLVFAIPVVFVIGVLLVSADAVFESLVTSTLGFDANYIFTQVFWSGVLSWIVLGYFRAAMFGASRPREAVSVFEPKVKPVEFSVTEHTTEDPDKPKNAAEQKNASESEKKFVVGIPEFLRFGVIETSVVLGMMNLLFLTFVIIQIPYLFGGIDLVQTTPDFKLAEYAKRGVGELIDVSFLVIPILLIVHWLLKKDNPVNEKVFRALAGTQVVLLFVILISAFQRLSLLTGSLGYGMTEFRFYAFFILLFLAMAFLWFSSTVLRGMRKHFAYGTVWTALFVLASLNFVNPEATIVSRNLELLKHGREFDAAYNASLSADATPELIKALPFLSPDNRLKVIKELSYDSCETEKGADFRSWNWSRSNAHSAVVRKGIKCGY